MTPSEHNQEEGNQGNEGSTPDMLELSKSISFCSYRSGHSCTDSDPKLAPKPSDFQSDLT